MSRSIERGTIWLVDLDPTSGREQAGRRPGLVVSADAFNESRAELVIVLPFTTTERRVRSHVPVDPPEGGLRRRSFIMCENVRAVSVRRLLRRFGVASQATMGEVEDRLRILLDL